MRTISILAVALIEEADIVAARQRGRQIACLLGFEAQDQTRIATAVSEIARNATTYGGGGRVEFSLEASSQPSLLIRIRDKGPGIADVDAILEGRFKSASGMGVGISGTRRLMDRFELDSHPGRGTDILLGKRLPHAVEAIDGAKLAEIGKVLAATGASDPLVEARTQNQELMQALGGLKAKQEETERLNTELEETNRGVVALYAELDEKAAQLAALNVTLEQRVAAAVTECQQANDALRQSQKMEAVGQLTGGIAHDFNNLLQIVTGNLETLSRRLPADDLRLRRAADNAMSGAQRAATLTQRLLAFARRQPLAPKPLDPNHLVDGMFDLMRRTLGETVSIDARLAPNLWRVEADANQLENALLNLAVNARDAMPPGGTLTISTANGIVGEADADEDATPGHYVSLAVCDTGSGMSEETMSRVFEPFFTTKEVGKGTGLGLSMVYGFVKQSGGHLRIESSLGRGTTVTLYLPKFTGPLIAEKVFEVGEAPPALPGEVVLVVEDDPDVRAHTCEVLSELGYAVIAVADGPAANEIIDSQTRIDLVFTDVVLTGPLNGHEIALHARSVRPDTPVLFTSGYAREAIIKNERLMEGVQLLAKPFSFADLS
ncbi:ATP-binding protein [uncultured Sphingomonas sp.]|uniref:ATP-binding protein n=1 Tax=uncultured Sphingomonas sp. TaxID=158754 RepID=UPI0035CB3A31